MSPLFPRAARAVLGAVALPSFAFLVPAAPQQIAGLTLERSASPFTELDSALARTPFRILDNVEGPYIDLGLFPVRPMVLSEDQAHLYAVNTHDSVVQHFDNLGGAPVQPVDTFRTPWGPVSIAIWANPASAADELLVVCRGTHVLVRMDIGDGAILGLVDWSAWTSATARSWGWSICPSSPRTYSSTRSRAALSWPAPATTAWSRST